MSTGTTAGTRTPATERPRGDRRARLMLGGSLGVLLLVTLACFFGPHLMDDARGQQALGDRLKGPAWTSESIAGRPLGTDSFGRDMVHRTLEGGQVSLQIAFLAATGAVVVGMLLGLVAGFRGGWVDRVVTGLSDVWVAFPFLVICLATVAVVGSDVWVLTGLLVLGGWVLPTKVTRTVAMRVRSEDYVAAARGAGATNGYLIRTHVLPQVLPANLVVWSFTVGTLVIIEGALSFLGLGVRPPQAFWGSLLSDGRGFLETAWWISVWPGLLLVVTVVATNVLGAALRRVWGTGPVDERGA